MILRLPPCLIKKYKGVFITGTDTGVGKTYIGCFIARDLKEKGISIGVMKPVSTGGRRDAILLKKSAGVDAPLDIINPVYFNRPLAPLVCASLERRRIDIRKVWSAYKDLCLRYKFLIVEGAGGLLVPITERFYMLDIAKRLGLPLIIVSRPGLGTINHTLLTVKIAKDCGLEVLGFVINYTTRIKKGLAEKTNPLVIMKLCKVRFLGEMPYNGKIG